MILTRTAVTNTIITTELEAGDIHIEDIAAHLSKLCRWNGSIPCFYSVAEHSNFVSHELEHRGFGPKVCLAGLLHDAPEYILGDIVRPVKYFVKEGARFGEASLEGLEELIAIRIHEKFDLLNLKTHEHQAIQVADEVALYSEVRDIFKCKPWWDTKLTMIEAASHYMQVQPLSEHNLAPFIQAKIEFLDRYTELKDQL